MYGLVDGVVWFVVEDQHRVLENFVLEAVDLDNCELLIRFRWILDAQSRVVNYKFGLLWLYSFLLYECMLTARSAASCYLLYFLFCLRSRGFFQRSTIV